MDIKAEAAPAPIPEPTVTTDDEKRAGSALLWKGLQLGGSKVLYLLGTLVLGRLLTPDDYGLVAIATVAITTVMFATETGMTNALVQATTRDREHYDVAWTIGLMRGLFICAVLWLTAPFVADLFGDIKAAPLVRLMAFVPLLNSLNSPRMADLMRELNFSRLAIVALSAVIIELAISIALAKSFGGAAVIIGKLAGAGTTAVASYFVAPYAPRFRPHYAAARQLIAFGRWLFAIGMTGVIADFFTKVLVARRLSVASLGLFSLGDRLAESPWQMANEAIGAVAFPLYARLRSDPTRLESAVHAHLTGLVFLLFPATALIIGLSPMLEERILGPQWTGIALVITLLALGYLCEVSFNVAYHLLQSLGWGGRLFAAELSQYIVLIASVSLLTGPYGLVGIGAARIITAFWVTFAGAKAAPPLFRQILKKMLWPTAALTLLSSLGGAAAWFTASYIPGVVGVGVGLVVGAVCYFGLVWLMDTALRLRVRIALSLFFPFLAARQV